MAEQETQYCPVCNGLKVANPNMSAPDCTCTPSARTRIRTMETRIAEVEADAAEQEPQQEKPNA